MKLGFSMEAGENRLPRKATAAFSFLPGQSAAAVFPAILSKPILLMMGCAALVLGTGSLNGGSGDVIVRRG
jgi:membrane protein YqaA with SNARE-associated domain